MSSQATGSFSSTPFPQVLVFLRRRALTGTLFIENLQGEDSGRIHFIDGLPACIEVKTATDRLGELLVIRGMLNAKALAGALRGMKERGVRLGRYLVDEGLVKPEDLRSVMEFQIERRLALLYSLSEESFTFHQDQNLTTFIEEDMVPVDPVPSMPGHLRETWDITRLESQLERLRGHGLCISASTEGSPRWTDQEMELLSSLDGRTLTLEEAQELGSSIEPTMQILLYVLMLSGGLELIEAPQAGAASPEPAREDPRTKKMRAAAREKLTHIKSGNFFTMIEVPEKAGVEEIRTSYLKLVKKFHPDTASSVEDEKLRESYLAISTKLREAFDALTDPEKRKNHMEKLHGGPSDAQEQAIVQQALSAEFGFQKASILARKRKWDEVAAIMRTVVKAEPQNGDYIALLLWAEVNLKPAGANLTEQEAGLRNAVNLASRSEKANYYLAQVLKKSGKETEARTYLEAVAGINPHNIEVKRELRILDRRRDQPQQQRLSIDGLLGRGKKDERDGEQEDEGALGKLKKILTKKI